MSAPRGTARLHAYTVLAAVGLLTALATGRPEPAALAAPFAIALVVGMAAATPPDVRVSVEPDTDRVVEGDTVVITLTVTAAADTRPVEVLLELPDGLDLIEPDQRAAWSVALRAGEPSTLEAAVDARVWGRYDVGRVVVRVRPAFGVLEWQWRLHSPRIVRVLPSAPTLRRILHPFDTRSDTGHQVARVRGEGIEFADVRAFRPGDRASRVNWRVTARRGETWVNDQHPERNADAVLLLDTFADGPAGGSQSLDRAVRVACSLADAMLTARDRVGVISLGGSTDWIAPALGERARWVVVEHLLASRARWSDAERSLRWLPPSVLPPRALVVAVTPLVDDRIVQAVVDTRRRGFDVTVIVLEPSLDADVDVPMTARRLWALERNARRRTLEATGVRVATLDDGDPLPLVVANLDHARARVGTVRR
jgi:uncharacterized protein (DUF58 family)